MEKHTLSPVNHKIKFEDTQSLSTTKSYYARLYREAIEIYKHNDNSNKREESLVMNKAWYPTMKNIKTKPVKKRKNGSTCLITNQGAPIAMPA